MDAIAGGPAIAIARQVGELDAVIGEHSVKPVRYSGDQGFEEAHGSWPIGLLVQLDEGELGGSVDRHEEVELAFLGANLGDIDVEVADRVGLELALVRCVAIDLRQPRDAVALQAAM